jgi:hypothetical protein
MQRESSNSPFPSYERSLKITGRHDYFTTSTSTAYHKLSLNPPIVDGMINPVPSSVSSVDHVVNLVTYLVTPVEKVVDPIPSSIDPTLLLESVTQVVDPFPPVDPILPLENETQVVDLISSSIDPTLPLESKPDTAHIFLVDTDTSVLGGIPPSPMEPPPSNDAILFDWGALTGPHVPSHIPFKITIQVCGRDIPQRLIDEGFPLVFCPLLLGKLWVILSLCQLCKICYLLTEELVTL